jgi:dCMP deaminase
MTEKSFFDRPLWHQYFMEIVKIVAERSTCVRRKVGAVLVKDKRILCSGYNGAPINMPHCNQIGCLRAEKSIPSGKRHELCRGVHAEQNVIIQAACYGISINESFLYCTNQPCSICAKMIINAKIKKIYYKSSYNDPLAMEIFGQAEIELIKL